MIMKRSHRIAVLVGFMAIVAFANTASAYYHPGIGRFTSRDPGPARVGSGGMASGGQFVDRDPYADGMNLYQYCGSNPLVYADPTGMWKKGEHTSLTNSSFDAAVKGLTPPMPYDREAIKQMLLKANLGQDGGDGFNDLKRHYNRDVDKTNKNVGPANTAYTTYLQSELKTYNDSIAADNPTKDDCIKSLEALGRVTHSWQDYYAHAVLMNGKAGPAWSATPQITGSPDNLNSQLKPSSWGGVVMAANPWGADEHGASEPASRDGKTGEKLRYNDANTYVTGRLQALYPTWEKKCACYFKK